MWYTKRTRMAYWSGSKLAHKIREKFGLQNPKSGTMEQWDQHEEDSVNKAPFIHYLTDTLFDKAQDVWLFIPDTIWSIRTANIWKFFRNLWLFRKCLWSYRSWDSSGLLLLMETAARDMAYLHENHGHLLKAPRSAHELKVWAELLKRIREDDYSADKIEFVKTGKKSLFGGWEHIQKPNTLPNYSHRKTFYAIESSVRSNDLELAAKIFRTKVKHWWD